MKKHEAVSATEEKNYLKSSRYLRAIFIGWGLIAIISFFIVFQLGISSWLKNFLRGSIVLIWVLAYLFYSAYYGLKYRVLPMWIFTKQSIHIHPVGKLAYRMGLFYLVWGILSVIGYILFTIQLFS